MVFAWASVGCIRGFNVVGFTLDVLMESVLLQVREVQAILLYDSMSFQHTTAKGCTSAWEEIYRRIRYQGAYDLF